MARNIRDFFKRPVTGVRGLIERLRKRVRRRVVSEDTINTEKPIEVIKEVIEEVKVADDIISDIENTIKTEEKLLPAVVGNSYFESFKREKEKFIEPPEVIYLGGKRYIKRPDIRFRASEVFEGATAEDINKAGDKLLSRLTKELSGATERVSSDVIKSWGAINKIAENNKSLSSGQLLDLYMSAMLSEQYKLYISSGRYTPEDAETQIKGVIELLRTSYLDREENTAEKLIGLFFGKQASETIEVGDEKVVVNFGLGNILNKFSTLRRESDKATLDADISEEQIAYIAAKLRKGIEFDDNRGYFVNRFKNKDTGAISQESLMVYNFFIGLERAGLGQLKPFFENYLITGELVEKLYEYALYSIPSFKGQAYGRTTDVFGKKRDERNVISYLFEYRYDGLGKQFSSFLDLFGNNAKRMAMRILGYVDYEGGDNNDDGELSWLYT